MIAFAESVVYIKYTQLKSNHVEYTNSVVVEMNRL